MITVHLGRFLSFAWCSQPEYARQRESRPQQSVRRGALIVPSIRHHPVTSGWVDSRWACRRRRRRTRPTRTSTTCSSCWSSETARSARRPSCSATLTTPSRRPSSAPSASTSRSRPCSSRTNASNCRYGYVYWLGYYAPPLIGGGIKRCFCVTSVCLISVWRLSDVCLSDVCLSVCLLHTLGLSREQRSLGRPKLAQK